MKLPLSLIRSFISTDLSIADVCSTLTLLGIEVDGVENEKSPFSGVIAAEVVACSPHPHADKLQMAKVHDGRCFHEIVCGASNCRPSLKVALALPGALLTDTKGNPFRIEKTKIRGIESAGMLCSAKELHIPFSSTEPLGILELPSDVELGSDLTRFLWDPVLEISLTPNLGHCFHALGIARELSAALQIPLHLPKVVVPAKGKGSCRVECKTPLCKRYIGCMVENVQIGPSPFWMQQILLAAGMKPISNAVDVTNYILLKWGQPMHVFDCDTLDGKILCVEETKDSETFICLDGIKREIPLQAIVIRDAHKTVAVAGVMGGKNSAITQTTRHLFLESAVFDPLSIRKTAKKMGLRTESSHHFEKGVDPVGCECAFEEALHWLSETTRGTVSQEKVDHLFVSLNPKQILCRPQKINEWIGVLFSQTEIQKIFHRLGFHTLEEKEALRVFVPLFRSDIEVEVDLIEEVARLYGYNHIPKITSRSTPSTLPHDPMYLFQNEVRNAAAGLGCQEFLSPDLISPALADLAQKFSQSQMELLHTQHSKSEEYSILRPSLLPGILQAVKHNFDRKNDSFSAFEIGMVYFKENQALQEWPSLALVLAGKKRSHWSHKPCSFDFYDLKGIIEALLEDLQMPKSFVKFSQHLSFHPGRQADLYLEDKRVGSLGQLHPHLLKKAGIEESVLFAELSLFLLLSFQKKHVRMTLLPQYPASERDWTVSLPKERSMDSLFQALDACAHSNPLFEKAELSDLYYPEDSSQKNATFRFTYRDPYKTLSSEEIEKAHQKLLAEITSER